MAALERDKAKIGADETIKLRKVYVAAIDRAINEIQRDFAEVRRGLRQNGIKVHFAEKDAKTLRHTYVCRGYEGSFDMLWTLIKAECETRVSAKLDTIV